MGSNQLVNEICDESRFKKSIQAEVAEARLIAGDGLFTAKSEEENWGLAHRILMPAFGPVSIKGMFDEMHDIVTQMALKWARYGSSNPIPASDDFTRLTLDTLALCSMGYRFNSFYKDELHPFVQSMGDSLTELGNRTQRPKWAKVFYRSSERKLFKDIDLMRTTSDELIKARRAASNGNKRKDLLTAMIEGVDARTGKKLSDESVINNLVTFLIAGHETTSGTLSFAFYSMLKNPQTFQKAQQEVGTIMGRDRITVDKLFKLKYIPAVSYSNLPSSTFSSAYTRLYAMAQVLYINLILGAARDTAPMLAHPRHYARGSRRHATSWQVPRQEGRANHGYLFQGPYRSCSIRRGCQRIQARAYVR